MGKIKEILDNFDFIKVQRVMHFLQWKWNNEGVPTIASLNHKAEDLLKAVKQKAKFSHQDEYIACGGFEARCLWDDGKKYYILALF